MKKEEFPTFLNEQPTIIFNRTGRELLIIAVGLGLAYLTWIRLGDWIHVNAVAMTVFKGIISAIVIIAALFVAFIKVATRPLEEWGFVWMFYVIIPKVYMYIPAEERVSLENQEELKEIVAISMKYDVDNDDDD